MEAERETERQAERVKQEERERERISERAREMARLAELENMLEIARRERETEKENARELTRQLEWKIELREKEGPSETESKGIHSGTKNKGFLLPTGAGSEEAGGAQAEEVLFSLEQSVGKLDQLRSVPRDLFVCVFLCVVHSFRDLLTS